VADTSDRGSQLGRGLAALELLATGPKSASEIARSLDVNRSTALRLLQELKSLGYAARDAETRAYLAVPARIWGLVANTPDHVDWGEVVNPLLASIRDECGEATILGVPAAGSMVYMSFFASTNPVAVRERLGTVRPMYCSAIGKGYLSAMSPEALDVELGRLTYQGGTDHAPRGPMELRAQIEAARAVGYAMDRDETFVGASCVAAPVRFGETLVGAAGISGPTARLDTATLERYGELLRLRLSALTPPVLR
jgi:DNA-binding IclR family transcriptional regulator